jgi:hypothetical protein
MKNRNKAFLTVAGLCLIGGGWEIANGAHRQGWISVAIGGWLVIRITMRHLRGPRVPDTSDRAMRNQLIVIAGLGCAGIALAVLGLAGVIGPFPSGSRAPFLLFAVAGALFVGVAANGLAYSRRHR